MASELKWN